MDKVVIRLEKVATHDGAYYTWHWAVEIDEQEVNHGEEVFFPQAMDAARKGVTDGILA